MLALNVLMREGLVATVRRRSTTDDLLLLQAATDFNKL